MIDITPLDIRKKRGDFRRRLRGYDPQEVDGFLELVAERLEESVREVVSLRERLTELEKRVERSEGRERAVQEALVIAQELREEIRSHAHREAELIRKEAEEEVERVRARIGALVDERVGSLDELERWRNRILRSLRSFLEQELETVAEEEKRDFSFEPRSFLAAEGLDGSTAEPKEGEEASPRQPAPPQEGMLPFGPEAGGSWSEPADREDERDRR